MVIVGAGVGLSSIAFLRPCWVRRNSPQVLSHLSQLSRLLQLSRLYRSYSMIAISQKNLRLRAGALVHFSRVRRGVPCGPYPGRFFERPFAACRGNGGWGRMRGPLWVPSLPPPRWLSPTKIRLAHKIIRQQVVSRIAQYNLPGLQDIAPISQAKRH